ncbi:hypothetical protein FD755_012582, partial [Muntiacus reevesi]
ISAFPPGIISLLSDFKVSVGFLECLPWWARDFVFCLPNPSMIPPKVQVNLKTEAIATKLANALRPKICLCVLHFSCFLSSKSWPTAFLLILVGTADEHTVQWWFKKFCKGDESLEDEKCSGWPSEVDNDQLRAIIKEVAEELSDDHSMVIWHLKQIGKVKKLDKWVPHELTENLKKRHFEVSSSLILRNSNGPFLEEAPKHFPKPILHQKKVMVTVCFFNLWDTITPEKYAQQIDKMHQKLQCLQLALVNKKAPVLLHKNAQLHIAQPMLEKLNELGYEVLPHPPYSPDLLQEAENAFQEFIGSRSMDFYATGINKLISCWQKYVDCNGSYFG